MWIDNDVQVTCDTEEVEMLQKSKCITWRYWTLPTACKKILLRTYFLTFSQLSLCRTSDCSDLGRFRLFLGFCLASDRAIYVRRIQVSWIEVAKICHCDSELFMTIPNPPPPNPGRHFLHSCAQLWRLRVAVWPWHPCPVNCKATPKTSRKRASSCGNQRNSRRGKLLFSMSMTKKKSPSIQRRWVTG